MTDRSAYPTRKRRLGESEADETVHLEAARRFEMVWEITLSAWAFKGLLFSRRDQYHEPAARMLREIRDVRARLVVTDLILAELHRHLVHGLGPVGAVGHLDTLKTDALVEEVFTDQELQRAALTDWIRRFDDQPFTFTDAVSFAVMRAQGVSTAFTFDQHFAVARFEVIPPRA